MQHLSDNTQNKISKKSKFWNSVAVKFWFYVLTLESCNLKFQFNNLISINN